MGKQRPDLPIFRRAREPGDCSSSGRLGAERRTRMALLASPDVGIRGRTFLESFDSPERVTNQLVLLNSAFLVLPSFQRAHLTQGCSRFRRSNCPSLAQSRFAREIVFLKARSAAPPARPRPAIGTASPGLTSSRARADE